METLALSQVVQKQTYKSEVCHDFLCQLLSESPSFQRWVQRVDSLWWKAVEACLYAYSTQFEQPLRVRPPHISWGWASKEQCLQFFTHGCGWGAIFPEASNFRMSKAFLVSVCGLLFSFFDVQTCCKRANCKLRVLHQASHHSPLAQSLEIILQSFQRWLRSRWFTKRVKQSVRRLLWGRAFCGDAVTDLGKWIRWSKLQDCRKDRYCCGG